jgi:hypothetical protein
LLSDFRNQAWRVPVFQQISQALRDFETWCQHIIGQRRTLEMVGSLFLKSDNPRPSPLL